MSVMNAVHMRVKPGHEEDCMRRTASASAATSTPAPCPAAGTFGVVRSGERAFIFVWEWEGMEAMVAARPATIANLDRLRPGLSAGAQDSGAARGRSAAPCLARRFGGIAFRGLAAPARRGRCARTSP